MPFKELLGVSKHINDIHKEIDHIAKSDSTVLIQGPSGTGKEIIANNIHYKSPRKGKPFEIINCGAIPPDLFESELFGHKKGAFTGATGDKKGKVEIADGGTLFLDEIGDLASKHQGKILRFLEDGSFCAVGGTAAAESDVRVIAATNKNLLEEKGKRVFRDDLYYRLNEYPIYTKSIFERPEDLIFLVNHFIFKRKLKVDDRVKFLLYSYDLPGNVRDLEKILRWTYDKFTEYLGKELALQGKKQLNDNRDETEALPSLKLLYSLVKPAKNLTEINLNEIKREILLEALAFLSIISSLSFISKKKFDLNKIVKAYEIIQLRQKTNLNQGEIAEYLHIRKDFLSPNKFKNRFGFEAPSKDCMYYLQSPLDLIKEPFSLEHLDNLYKQ